MPYRETSRFCLPWSSPLRASFYHSFYQNLDADNSSVRKSRTTVESSVIDSRYTERMPTLHPDEITAVFGKRSSTWSLSAQNFRKSSRRNWKRRPTRCAQSITPMRRWLPLRASNKMAFKPFHPESKIFFPDRNRCTYSSSKRPSASIFRGHTR